MINDFWFRFVSDVGLPGPDMGKGGKYLLLPPDIQVMCLMAICYTLSKPTETSFSIAYSP
jgi:hypothetical protein